MRKFTTYIGLFAAFLLLTLASCDDRDAAEVTNEDASLLQLRLGLAPLFGNDGSMLTGMPGDLPARVAVFVANSKGMIEYQSGHTISAADNTLTIKLKPGTKNIYVYAISNVEGNASSFTADNYVLFRNNANIQYQGDGVAQFRIPKVSTERELQELGFVVKPYYQGEKGTNMIYSGVLKGYQHINTGDTKSIDLKLYRQLSRVEVRLFTDQYTKDQFPKGFKSIGIEGLNFLSSSKLVFLSDYTVAELSQYTAPSSLPSWFNSLAAAVSGLTTPWYNSRGGTLTDLAYDDGQMQIYDTTKTGEVQKAKADFVAYTAPIFSSVLNGGRMHWGIPTERQPKIRLTVVPVDGSLPAATFPICDASTLNTAAAVKPADGVLLPGYVYKIDIVLSVVNVTVKYYLEDWNKKVVDVPSYE